LALDKLYTRLAKEAPGASVIAQVHDAIYVETPADIADAVAKLVEECMNTTLTLVAGAQAVPFTATAKIGNTWAEVS